MKLGSTLFLVVGALAVACGDGTDPGSDGEDDSSGGTSSGDSSGSETGESTGDEAESSTTSTTMFTTTGPTTGDPGPDYWDEGVCNGINMASSPDCKDVDFAGFCDDDGNAVWCENNMLFCIPCEEGGDTCGYVDEMMWYDCIAGGGTTDSTSTDDTGTDDTGTDGTGTDDTGTDGTGTDSTDTGN